MQRLRDSNLARIMDRWPTTRGHNCKYNPNEIEEAGVTVTNDAWPMTRVREARCRVRKDWCELSLCEPFFPDEICSLIYSQDFSNLIYFWRGIKFSPFHSVEPMSGTEKNSFARTPSVVCKSAVSVVCPAFLECPVFLASPASVATTLVVELVVLVAFFQDRKHLHRFFSVFKLLGNQKGASWRSNAATC